MERARVFRIAVLGGLWGGVEGFLVRAWPFGVTPDPLSSSFQVYGTALLQFGVLILIGFAAAIGYALDDYRNVVYSLALAQPVYVAFSFGSIFTPIFLAGAGFALFLIGLVSGVGGAGLHEWQSYRNGFRIAWIPLAEALAVQTIIVAISLLLFRTLAIEQDQFSGVAYLDRFMPILLIVGFLAFGLDIIVKGQTTNEIGGGLIIASLLLGSLTLSEIGFVSQTLNYWGNIPSPAQGNILAQFHLLSWTLYIGLAIPLLVFLRIVFSQE